MSLILEALKKSERQRRLGEAPSLGSPVMAVHRRRSKLPLLVVLIIAALVVGWWLRRTPAPDPTPAAPGVSEIAPAKVSATPAPATDAPAAPEIAPGPPERERAQSTADARLPRSKATPDATTGMPADVREKVSNGELVVANPALLKPGQAATVDEREAVLPAPVAQAPPEASAPAAPLGPAAGDAAVVVEKSVPTPPAVDAPKPPTAPNPGVSPVPAVTPGASNTPLLLWELPYAQRREIPELKLSMHVYGSDPAKRFVIINGNRQVEGDEVESLKLIEIRADGVVFEHQGQRFLYPRGGR